jgi:hypothetical protein
MTTESFTTIGLADASEMKNCINNFSEYSWEKNKISSDKEWVNESCLKSVVAIYENKNSGNYRVASWEVIRVMPYSEIHIPPKPYISLQVIWGIDGNFAHSYYSVGGERFEMAGYRVVETNPSKPKTVSYRGSVRVPLKDPMYFMVMDLEKVERPQVVAEVEPAEEVAPEKETIVIAGPASMQQSIITDEWRARVQAALAKKE